MADFPDPTAPGRGEQPLYTPVNTGSQAPPYTAAPPPPMPPPPGADGYAPGYNGQYPPPYAYAPPAAAGLPENVAAGLAYVTVIPAIVFLLVEPYRRSAVVRFHSWQSIFLLIGLAVVRTAERLLDAMLPSFLAFSFSGLLSLVFFVAWLVAIIKAFQGSQYQLPVVGPFAASAAASSTV